MNIEMDTENNALNAVEGSEKEAPQKPILSLSVSQDLQELNLELIRTTADPLNPVFEDVMQAVADIGVVFGIDKNIIRALCRMPRYDIQLTIARGKRAKIGADGAVKYLIETSKDMRPKINNDGTVDYRDLGYVQNVLKGQVLCEITPAQKGDDGMDVYGSVLPGIYGKEAHNVAGKNTEYSEDKTKLISLVSGNAEVIKGAVNVNELLRINGNVDNSTGDINFVGDVQISGDVLSGFKVISKGNIIVKGTVDGASMQADEDIVVNGGINGMNNGSIVAGGNIKCRYIQSCYINAGGNIYADSIMYCNTECGGNVELNGKRGVLIGGKALITGVLQAKVIGTDSHIATYVQMCNTDGLHKELIELQKQVAHFDEELLRFEQIVNRYTDLKSKGIVKPELEASMGLVATSLQQTMNNRTKVTERIESIKQQQMDISKNNNSYIECKGRVHSGVVIAFGPLNMRVSQSFVFSRISIAEEKIIISPLGAGLGR